MNSFICCSQAGVWFPVGLLPGLRRAGRTHPPLPRHWLSVLRKRSRRPPRRALMHWPLRLHITSRRWSLSPESSCTAGSSDAARTTCSCRDTNHFVLLPACKDEIWSNHRAAEWVRLLVWFPSSLPLLRMQPNLSLDRKCCRQTVGEAPPASLTVTAPVKLWILAFFWSNTINLSTLITGDFLTQDYWVICETTIWLEVSFVCCNDSGSFYHF